MILALNDKYGTLRDKLLLESLMTQYGKVEWSKMSEQERQNQLARMKLLGKKLRKEGKYDELAKLFEDAAKNSDSLNVCSVYFTLVTFLFVLYYESWYWNL